MSICKKSDKSPSSLMACQHLRGVEKKRNYPYVPKKYLQDGQGKTCDRARANHRQRGPS